MAWIVFLESITVDVDDFWWIFVQFKLHSLIMLLKCEWTRFFGSELLTESQMECKTASYGIFPEHSLISLSIACFPFRYRWCGVMIMRKNLCDKFKYVFSLIQWLVACNNLPCTGFQPPSALCSTVVYLCSSISRLCDNLAFQMNVYQAKPLYNRPLLWTACRCLLCG